MRKITVKSHKRVLKDGRVLFIRKHDRILPLQRHGRSVNASNIASSAATKIASKSIRKKIIINALAKDNDKRKEAQLNAHTDRKAIQRLKDREKAFYDPKVRRLIQSAAPNTSVSSGATKQLNAELTTYGKEIARRALKYMADDDRSTILARDIIAANEDIQLERRTSNLYGKNFDYKDRLLFGNVDERKSAKKIKKLYK